MLPGGLDRIPAIRGRSAEHDSGASLVEQVEGLIKRARTDERRAELEAEIDLPPFPLALAYLWEVFLRRRCGVGFAGRPPIGWADIDAIMRHAGVRLAPWEVEVMERLDDVVRGSVAGRMMTATLVNDVVSYA